MILHIHSIIITSVTNFKQDVSAEVEQIKKAMGAEIGITFDCAGFTKTMSTALGATSAGGKVCLVGMGHTEMTVPLAPAAVRYLITYLFILKIMHQPFLFILSILSRRIR